MRVKRLEIQGFKSFKDRTVVHFDHSITGIVGPNGCGKSNIVDAFFWVMGEQSYKHMRGNSSNDLIFNGSSKYSPLGMAEATLVMESDLPDADPVEIPEGATFKDTLAPKTKETSVTRRLYRSGEGEYLINGTQARLKDIQELFMDTGVGAKGYSVIEQGQIGKIVNSKPEERRLLIEEAAGIAKYKARKKESLRKMEATQANLARLTDIIQEIEKGLGSLERQAQKARQYKKYKDELLDKEMTWGRRKNRHLRERLRVLQNQRDSLEHDLAGMKAHLQTLENSVEIDRVVLLTDNKEAESFQGQIQDLAGDLSHEKSALELSRRRQGDLTSQLEALAVERDELQVSIEGDTEKLAEQEQQSIDADQLFQSAAREAQELQKALQLLRKDVDEARTAADQCQRRLMNSIHQTADMNSKTGGLTSKAESAQAQAERLLQQSEAQEAKQLEIREELEKAKQAQSELQEGREILQARRKEQVSQLQEQESEVRTLEKEREQSLRALTQLKSKLQSLEELDQSHEGLADGPKAALDWAKANGHSDRIIAFTDAVQVQAGYEGVLESWLENQIESLIAKDVSAIFPLLEQIQKDKTGRVTFQINPKSATGPMSDARKVSRTQKTPSAIKAALEGLGLKFLGEFSEFVTWNGVDSEYLEPLFQQVYVVETSASLSELVDGSSLKALPELADVRALVSKDGVVLDLRGSVRAGHLKATGAVGILRRKRTIEELRGQIIDHESRYSSAEQAVDEAKEAIEIARAQQQSTQSELQALEVQTAGIQRDIHQTERAFQDARKQHEAILRDTEMMKRDAERAVEDRKVLEAKLETLLSERSQLEASMSQLEVALKDKEAVYEEQDTELQTLRVREASLKERAVSLKRETEATKSLKSDRERRLSEVRRTLDRASREQEEFSGGEDELAEKIQTLTLELATAREALAQVKDRIEQSNAKVNTALETIKSLHKSTDQKTTESTHLALEVEKLSGELTHLLQNLEEKYGPGCLNIPIVTVATVAQVVEAIDGLASEDGTGPAPTIAQHEASELAELSPEEEIALGEDVERLRERIRRLGEVNVMAIEEFEELKKRYDHLLSEKADLDHSLKNLESAIEHINKTSEERFKKAFEAIAGRFERLFPIIFGGGQAQLSLVYPEGSKDILEAGVDILAQPPGKKVANITLLSGGEKALTAVSLIFAIFMVKPSPFCVLDEVDAPLDDANIGKFNALLKEMSAKSQFILITHNKKTMELNDTLYGVTMEEPGVSKMVSIEMH